MKQYLGALLIILFFATNIAVATGIPCKTNQDTIKLASVVRPMEITVQSPVIEVQMKIDKTRFIRNGKTYLLLKGLKMEKAPEGVYEIYLTNKPYHTDHLSPLGSFFISVINTYNINDEALFEIPRKAGPMSQLDGDRYFIYVIFRGNTISGTRKAQNAGHLKINEIAIVQMSIQ